MPEWKIQALKSGFVGRIKKIQCTSAPYLSMMIASLWHHLMSWQSIDILFWRGHANRSAIRWHRWITEWHSYQCADITAALWMIEACLFSCLSADLATWMCQGQSEGSRVKKRLAALAVSRRASAWLIWSAHLESSRWQAASRFRCPYSPVKHQSSSAHHQHGRHSNAWIGCHGTECPVDVHLHIVLTGAGPDELMPKWTDRQLKWQRWTLLRSSDVGVLASNLEGVDGQMMMVQMNESNEQKVSKTIRSLQEKVHQTQNLMQSVLKMHQSLNPKKW